MLNKVKELFGKESYDDVIRIAVEELLNVSRSMFGVDKGRLSEFKEEDRLYGEEE